LTLTLTADWTVRKLVFCLPFKIPFFVGPGWGSIFIALWYWEGRVRATQVSCGSRKYTYCIIQNLYDILLVIFVLSTPELVKNAYFHPCFRKKFKILHESQSNPARQILLTELTVEKMCSDYFHWNFASSIFWPHFTSGIFYLKYFFFLDLWSDVS
jgi:hypothetical protein